MIPRLSTGAGRALADILLDILTGRVLVVVVEDMLLGLPNALVPRC